MLFYRLAKECGINARVITGYGTNSALPHCWNIVEINNHFYYLDATWDSELAPNYSYYLKIRCNRSNFLKRLTYAVTKRVSVKSKRKSVKFKNKIIYILKLSMPGNSNSFAKK